MFAKFKVFLKLFYLLCGERGGAGVGSGAVFKFLPRLHVKRAGYATLRIWMKKTVEAISAYI